MRVPIEPTLDREYHGVHDASGETVSHAFRPEAQLRIERGENSSDSAED